MAAARAKTFPRRKTKRATAEAECITAEIAETDRIGIPLRTPRPRRLVF